VIARFPAALDHVLRRSPRNATKEMLLKLRVSGEWAREQLDPKPHPAAVLGSSSALGAILAVGGFAVGLVAWVAIVIGLALALTVGLAMIWVTRFPSRHEQPLAVRMSTVRWVGELFNEIGPTDLRGATPDTSKAPCAPLSTARHQRARRCRRTSMSSSGTPSASFSMTFPTG